MTNGLDIENPTIMDKDITSNEEMTPDPDPDPDPEDYGFFCDLESSYEDVEYYVIAKRTHYEVRRKFTNRPVIHGETRIGPIPERETSVGIGRFSRETKYEFRIENAIIDLECSKSSIEDFLSEKKRSPDQPKRTGLISYIKNIPRNIYYALLICCTTSSCIYFIMTLPDYND